MAKEGKKHEEFTLKDVNQLLCMMIEVNPYTAPRNPIGEAWKDIVQKTQAAGYYLGCDVDTCKNHIGLLLGWCEVHPMCLLFLSDTNIHALYLGREGKEASLLTHSPGRPRPTWWVLHHFAAKSIPLPTSSVRQRNSLTTNVSRPRK